MSRMTHAFVQRYPRHRVMIAAELIDTSTAQLRTVSIRDLSLGGARIADDTPPAIGTEIRLRVSLEGSIVALAAKVVHVIPDGDQLGRPRGMGVQFLMPDQVRDVMRRYLDKIARENNEEDGATWAALPSPFAPAPIDL
jgi:Tfp pilus assembly protein PilZ